MGLLVLLAASVQAAAVFPLPPFTVYGKVRDWNGRALSSADAATVIVKDTNGVELARCDVKSGGYPAVTYRVRIPMASGRMEGRGQVGDALAFEVYYDGQLHGTSGGRTLRVGNPASAACCSLNLGTFSYGDGLPDEYREFLLYYYQMAGRGWELSDVKADDDFDGDGFSNLQEYLAGTMPVLADDYLKITAFNPLANGHLALSFLSAPGRTYTVPASPTFGSNTWNEAAFAVTTNASSAQTFYTSDQDANTTLYLSPTNKAAFFKLGVQ